MPNTHLGKLMPQPMPQKLWANVSMDIVEPSSEATRSFNCIMVSMDCFTKMAHYVACRTIESTEELAHCYVERIFSLHG